MEQRNEGLYKGVITIKDHTAGTGEVGGWGETHTHTQDE